jgi:hypothetical protein
MMILITAIPQVQYNCHPKSRMVMKLLITVTVVTWIFITMTDMKVSATMTRPAFENDNYKSDNDKNDKDISDDDDTLTMMMRQYQ